MVRTFQQVGQSNFASVTGAERATINLIASTHVALKV